MTADRRPDPAAAPSLRALSLAGVQSSTLVLASRAGRIEPFGVAVFAGTRCEPPQVYAHLRYLESFAAQHKLPVVRVSAGNIRADALDPGHRFASMPPFTLGPNGKRGMARRVRAVPLPRRRPQTRRHRRRRRHIRRHL